VERFNRRPNSRLYKWLTRKTYHYIDVLGKFISGYDSVHSNTGMTPSRVSDKDVLCVWKTMTKRQASIKRTPPIYSVGERVRSAREDAVHQGIRAEQDARDV
jgi:hypothetical protein